MIYSTKGHVNREDYGCPAMDVTGRCHFQTIQTSCGTVSGGIIINITFGRKKSSLSWSCLCCLLYMFSVFCDCSKAQAIESQVGVKFSGTFRQVSGSSPYFLSY